MPELHSAPNVGDFALEFEQLRVAVAVSIGTRNAEALKAIIAAAGGPEAVASAMSAMTEGKQGNIFMALARAALPPAMHIQPIMGKSGGRLSWLLWRGILAGRRSNDPAATGAVPILELLASTGWRPAAMQMKSLVDVAASMRDCEALVFFGEKGWLPPMTGKTFMEAARSTLICEAFSSQSPQDLAALAKLVDLGVFVDRDGFIGLMDFAALSLYECAHVLDSKGFAPRATAIAHASLAHHGEGCGVGPAAMMARLFSGDHWTHISKTPPSKWHGSLEASFDWLASRGGSFSVPADAVGKRLDPFRALAKAPMRNASSSLAVLASLARHGAIASESERYLAEEVASMNGRDERFLAMAIEAGAHKSASPTRVFAALAGWRSDGPGSAPSAGSPDPALPLGQKRVFSALAGWRDGGVEARASSFAHYFKKLGIDPAKVDAGARATHHPLSIAIVRKQFALGSLFIELGMSPIVRSRATGETLLHALALDDSAAGALFTQQLLAIPGMAPLVDMPSRPEAPESTLASGRTALMRAAGALSLGQAKALLGAGADPNLQDSHGFTALRYLSRKSGTRAQEKSAPMVRLLLAAGADPSIADNKGGTPATAMADAAPIDALAEILESSPDSLDGPKGAKAQLSLIARGAKGVAIVERALLSSDSGAASMPSIPVKTRPRL